MIRRAPAPWPSRTGAAIALIALVAAFLVVLQARTERQTRRQLGIPTHQLAELAYRMQREERRRAELEAEVARLRQHIADMTEAAAKEQRALQAFNAEVRRYRDLAGFTPVQGSGIVIELSDNPRPLRLGQDPNDALLHYTDLVRVVGDLWAAGAEAVAINDERLTGTSSWQRKDGLRA